MRSPCGYSVRIHGGANELTDLCEQRMQETVSAYHKLAAVLPGDVPQSCEVVATQSAAQAGEEARGGPMTRPDRFAQLVGKHRHIACDGMGYIILEETVRHLLRLQHRAYVRMVKHCQATSQFPYNHHMQFGSDNAFEMILAELAIYKKGIP